MKTAPIIKDQNLNNINLDQKTIDNNKILNSLIKSDNNIKLGNQEDSNNHNKFHNQVNTINKTTPISSNIKEIKPINSLISTEIKPNKKSNLKNEKEKVNEENFEFDELDQLSFNDDLN